MSVSSYQFIDPQILAAIANLQLIAKTVVDGFMLGSHQSPKPGVGLEFNQYRSYQPGDDLRRVDWKMYARSDRYFVRESEIETSIGINFVLDATASMSHVENQISKFDYARFLIASLAYLARSQGDAVGLMAVNGQSVSQLPPRRDHQHLHRFLHQLENIAPQGRWPDWQVLETIFTVTQKREVIVFVSDMYERESEIQKLLSVLSSYKNEVLLFHIMGNDELQFNYKGHLIFEDLETGETVQVHADKSREDYLHQLDEHLQKLQQSAHDQNIAYEQCVLNQPLDYALRNYLMHRTKKV